MKTDTFYFYPERRDVRLDCYLLDSSDEMPGSNRRPAVIINPGGAYVYCSDREAEPIAARFLGMGYHAFVLRYTTFHGMEGKGWPDDVTKLPPAKKETVYPVPILEIGQAMLRIREHADEWNLDPDKIGVCGFSAGGHNAAMYSSLWNRPFLKEHFGVESNELKPGFCILGYPFIDYVFNAKYPFGEYEKTAYRWMYLDYFGTPDPDETAMREGSADYQVSEANPPTFIWTTSTDMSVPCIHSIKMAEALAKHQVPFELHIFGEGQHGLALADETSASSERDINPVVAAWTQLAFTWLKRQL